MLGFLIVPTLANSTPHTLPEALLATAAFGFVGILLSLAGYKLFDWAIPVSFSKELEKGNIAIGILCGAIVIGICHVISAAIG